MTCFLRYVTSLNYSVTEQDLIELFSPFGELVGVRLATKPGGQSKGFAFVEFANEKAATAAVLSTNGTKLKGRDISVAISNPPKKAGGRDAHGYARHPCTVPASLLSHLPHFLT